MTEAVDSLRDRIAIVSKVVCVHDEVLCHEDIQRKQRCLSPPGNETLIPQLSSLYHYHDTNILWNVEPCNLDWYQISISEERAPPPPTIIIIEEY